MVVKFINGNGVIKYMRTFKIIIDKDNNIISPGLLLKGRYELVRKIAKKVFMLRGWNFQGGVKIGDDNWFFPIWVYKDGKLFK